MHLRFPWLATLLAALLSTGCLAVVDLGDDDDTAAGDDDASPSGDDDASEAPVDADADGFDNTEDCDDTEPAVNPGAREACNGRDDDCDGEIDDAGASGESAWYADADGDGYGDSSARVLACEAPAGTVADDTDCDDLSAQAHPGADEVCGDGLDNDCDNTGNGCGPAGDVPLEEAIAIEGEKALDWFGGSIARVGDVNGDGEEDLLIGAHQEDTWGSSAGAAYLLYGPITARTSLEGAGVVKFTGEAGGDWAGYAVAGAGDVNGDGRADLLIGAPYEDTGGPNAGAAYLFYGPIDPGTVDLSQAPVKLTGAKTGEALGSAVASAGDVNGDGFDDLLVGAPKAAAESGLEAGAAYLFLGPVAAGVTSVTRADTRLTGEAAYAAAGYAVASGDFNDDAFSDVLVGAPFAGASGHGAAYVVYGPIDTGDVSLSSAALILTGEASGDNAGRYVANGGDLDGDGTADLLVTAYYADSGRLADAGVVYLVSGGATGAVSLSSALAELHGDVAMARAGRAIAGAGDVNGDGTGDLLIGALGDTTAGVAGGVYLVHGPVTGVLSLGDADARFGAVDLKDTLGYAVGAAGDLDEDGFDDLLIGAPERADSTTFPGEVYVVHGGPGL